LNQHRKYHNNGDNYIEFGVSQVQTLAALPNSEIFEFLKALDIKKMFVKGEQNIVQFSF
jgi:hypothetical protein